MRNGHRKAGGGDGRKKVSLSSEEVSVCTQSLLRRRVEFVRLIIYRGPPKEMVLIAFDLQEAERIPMGFESAKQFRT